MVSILTGRHHFSLTPHPILDIVSLNQSIKETYMAREHLSNRSPWQPEANQSGMDGEKVSGDVILNALETLYPGRFTAKMGDDKYKQERIHFPNGKNYCTLDFRVDDTLTGKSLYFESKRQGARGNAHERAYKYFPGTGISEMVKQHLTKKTGISHTQYPIVFIFSGDMVGTDKYKNECKVQFSPCPYIYLMYNGDIDRTIKFVEYIVKAYFDGQDIWC